MKKVLLGSLLASGLLFAAKNNDLTEKRLSYDEQIALASQSPPVYPEKTHKHQKAERRADRVVMNKDTVVALVPYGK